MKRIQQNPQFVRTANYQDARSIQNDTYSGEAGDLLAHVLYDTNVFLANPSQSTSFFKNPIGNKSGAQDKDATWTNMVDSGKLPAGQKFLMKFFRAEMVIPDPTTEDTIAQVQAFIRVMQASRFRISVPGREFEWEAPGSMLVPNIPVIGTSTVASTFNTMLSAVAPKIALESPVTVGSVDGAPVSFSVEHFISTSDAGVSDALAVLAGADQAKAIRLRISLPGTLIRLK